MVLGQCPKNGPLYLRVSYSRDVVDLSQPLVMFYMHKLYFQDKQFYNYRHGNFLVTYDGIILENAL